MGSVREEDRWKRPQDAWGMYPRRKEKEEKKTRPAVCTTEMRGSCERWAGAASCGRWLLSEARRPRRRRQCATRGRTPRLASRLGPRHCRRLASRAALRSFVVGAPRLVRGAERAVNLVLQLIVNGGTKRHAAALVALARLVLPRGVIQRIFGRIRCRQRSCWSARASSRQDALRLVGVQGARRVLRSRLVVQVVQAVAHRREVVPKRHPTMQPWRVSKRRRRGGSSSGPSARARTEWHGCRFVADLS
jgi:hypothetical protein